MDNGQTNSTFGNEQMRRRSPIAEVRLRDGGGVAGIGCFVGPATLLVL